MANLLSVGRSSADPNLADWHIDGAPLARWMSRFDCAGPTPGDSSVLATRDLDDLRALLGRPGGVLPSGRVPLYGCARCADLDCGVFAVRVTHDQDTVSWTDFAWEYGSDQEPGPSADYAALPTIRFDRERYEAVLGQLLR
ncbi:hypothetical protein [Crossiella cryophila]|uniref:Oxidoreductase n=1 Tax=Crossiella cryophila TaxID=43355 RepID=A0A7W7CFS2_9PSEU|nr:hypothetical protein [Crossiella cryophila]MBB4678694.1 hypothetical protein [Crossiella cryophila]